MVCLSPSGTTKLVDSLSKDDDIDLKFWMDDMKQSIEVCVCCVNIIQYEICNSYYPDRGYYRHHNYPR